MKKTLITALMMASLAPAASADNVADCEVLVREAVMLDDKETGAFIDTYLPATDYIASIYDEEDGHISQALGKDIKALFCTRHNVIPTLRDFPLLATGIPFAVSTDFDGENTALIFYMFDGDKFVHAYEGPELSLEEAARLSDAMDVFNLQPHDLGK